MLRKVYFKNNMQEVINKLNSRKEDINLDVTKTVECILKDIRQNGDDAVIKYTEKFDKYKIRNIAESMVTTKEIEEGLKNVGKDFVRILNRAKQQIIEFHKNQINKSWNILKKDGVIMGQIVRPLKRVAVYVPGGTACYPSTVLMNVIPAKLAGVEEIIMFTPVKEDGKVSDDILAAAKISGVTSIYKIGGAQAIGAAAYGTQSIKKVDKIIGPRKYICCNSKKTLLWISGY